MFEKNDFKKTNSFKNYKEAIVSYLAETIFIRRIDELIEKNNQRFINAYITDFEISDLDEFRVAAVTLKEDEILPFLGELTIPIIPFPPLLVTL